MAEAAFTASEQALLQAAAIEHGEE
jgi:hypothetical protein